jgi:hypothetical protein
MQMSFLHRRLFLITNSVSDLPFISDGCRILCAGGRRWDKPRHESSIWKIGEETLPLPGGNVTTCVSRIWLTLLPGEHTPTRGAENMKPHFFCFTVERALALLIRVAKNADRAENRGRGVDGLMRENDRFLN